MNEHAFRFGIYYRVPRRHETPAVIGAKVVASLDALSRIDPLFADWKVPHRPTMTYLPLAVARTRIAAIVEDNVVRNKSDQPEPESGYSMIIVTDSAIPSRIVRLFVSGGGLSRDELMLLVGDPLYPTDLSIVKYGLFREALLATSTIWQPTWAAVAAIRADYSEKPIIPGVPLFPYSALHIPWIAYLSPTPSLRFSLPADIRTERAPDGGLLMTTTEEPLEPTNPEHLRRARILAETMLAAPDLKVLR
jgi:hypothetical protein